jgi:hypothetical protein
MGDNTLKVLLVAITIVAAVEGVMLASGENTPTQTSCDDSQRYPSEIIADNDGGVNIDIKTKEAQITAYTDLVKEDSSAFRFCIISKKAIDSIFSSDAKHNALICEMAMNEDNTAKTIIFSGLTSKHFEITDNIANSKNFASRYYCPRRCQVD